MLYLITLVGVAFAAIGSERNIRVTSERHNVHLMSRKISKKNWKPDHSDVMPYNRWRKLFVKNALTGKAGFEKNERLHALRRNKEFRMADRRKIYEENVETIIRHNALYEAGAVGWSMGVNEYSDLTFEEFKEVVGIGCTFNRTRADNVVRQMTPAADSVDWRKEGAVTKVKNQEQCGSCWAFSTTGSVEGAVKVAGGNLVSLSEQQLVDCSKSEGNHGCQGGLMDYGFKYIIQNGGIDTEEDYPYTAKNGVCNSSKQRKHVSEIKAFHDVTAENERELASAVTNQPVSVAIEADQTAFQHYKSGVFDSTCGTKLDHGVLIVGYDADSWIVKNSWGATWGEEGYIRMKRGVSRKGICGIAMQPSYPVAGDAPPSPGPTPGPPGPSAAYEDPYKTKCSEGEIMAKIEGVDGEICMPECTTSSDCPATPAGFHAEAQCVIQNEATHKKYCGLICKPTAFFSCDRRKNLTCKSIQSTGICTYDA